MNRRGVRSAALFAAALLMAAPSAGALSLDVGWHHVDLGNGRADYGGAVAALPGSARTSGHLVRATFHDPVRGMVNVDLGSLTTEAARLGSVISELYVEGFKAGDQAVPTVAYHAGGRENPSRSGTDVSLDLQSKSLQTQLALAKFRLETGNGSRALASVDAASGEAGMKNFDFVAHLGERGWYSEVSRDQASSRWAVTLEDVSVRLGSLLPAGLLPLGTSLELVTELQLPLGDTLGASVAGVMRMTETLAEIQRTLVELEQLRGSLDDAAAGQPALKAALDAVDAAEAALVAAANDLAAAVSALDAAQAASAAAQAAVAAANSSVAAAQTDLNNANASAALAQQAISGLDAEIAALNAELATASPARLLQIPGEIAARQAARASAASQLATAQHAQSVAATALANATATVQSRSAVASSAAAAAAAAQADVAAKTAALSRADAALLAAEAAVAAQQTVDAVVGDVAARQAALRASLHTLLQQVSDLLAVLPPLPVLQQDLDQALRATPIVQIGGMALETDVRAHGKGGSTNVHCTVERIAVLGYSPDVKQCSDLIELSKEAVAQVNELLRTLGAIGVDGLEIKGPHGTWNEPGRGADGRVRAEGQMSAFTLKVPSVQLAGLADSALGQVRGVLDLIQARQVSRVMLPTITPSATPNMEMMAAAGRVSVMAARDPGAKPDAPTLGSQLQQVSDELSKLEEPEALQGLETGGIDLVIAQAQTRADFLADGDGVDPEQYCQGDAACIAACLAGNCPPGGPLGGGAHGSGHAGDTGPGGRGHGHDLGGGSGNGAKLPMTGAADGLTAVGLLGLGGLGLRALRRK